MRDYTYSSVRFNVKFDLLKLESQQSELVGLVTSRLILRIALSGLTCQRSELKRNKTQNGKQVSVPLLLLSSKRTLCSSAASHTSKASALKRSASKSTPDSLLATRAHCDRWFNTSVPNIRCTSDVTFGSMLAQKSEEGIELPLQSTRLVTSLYDI